MPNPTLRLRDGFADKSPHLRDDVKTLQQALKKAGYKVGTDGLFGQGTQTAVKQFQRDRRLVADGIVGAGTWRALGRPKKSPAPSTTLKGFRGDLSWVHAREGHAGKAYWARGESGVTLDPGVDLGYVSLSILQKAYKPLLPPEQYTAVKKVMGVKKEDARAALKNDPGLQKIRITRAQADTKFPFAARPYWDAIAKRFPALKAKGTPGSVQTALLSLSYNRGAGNRGLGGLATPLEKKNWAKVADLIGSMQQDHKLAGIRKRRKMEAALIRKELKGRS